MEILVRWPITSGLLIFLPLLWVFNDEDGGFNHRFDGRDTESEAKLENRESDLMASTLHLVPGVELDNL